MSTFSVNFLSNNCLNNSKCKRRQDQSSKEKRNEQKRLEKNTLFLKQDRLQNTVPVGKIPLEEMLV